MQQQQQQLQTPSQQQQQTLQQKRPLIVRTTPSYLPAGGGGDASATSNSTTTTTAAAAAAAAAAKRRRIIGGAGGASGVSGYSGFGGFAPANPIALSDRAIQLAPECGAYRELWRLERRLDEAIRARRAALHEAQRRQAPRPRRRLRLQLSSHFGIYGQNGEQGWELRIEGRALDDCPLAVVASSGGQSGASSSSAAVSATALSSSLAAGGTAGSGSGSASSSGMASEPGMSSSTAGASGTAGGGGGPGGRRRFSSYLSSLVVELDRSLYGGGVTGLHLAEWSQSEGLADTDGFVVRRAGEQPVRVTVLITPEHQPPQFRLQPQLAKLLGLHTGTRAQAVQAFWQYVNEKSLLDPLDRAAASLVLDPPLADLFRPDGQSARDPVRMAAADVPRRLQQLLLPPEPLVLHYLVSAEPGVKRCVNYELELDAEDPAARMAAAQAFPFSPAAIQELNLTESRISDAVEQMNSAAQQAEFYGQFAADPQQFLTNALLKSGGSGSQQHQQHHHHHHHQQQPDPDEERRASFFNGGWLPEAAAQYFAEKIDQRRHELEQLLGIR